MITPVGQSLLNERRQNNMLKSKNTFVSHNSKGKAAPNVVKATSPSNKQLLDDDATGAESPKAGLKLQS